MLIAFLYTEAWHTKVVEITNGDGVNVVYESVGSTLEESFNATKTGGTVVFYGMAGGNPAPVDAYAYGYFENFNWRRPLERAYIL